MCIRDRPWFVVSTGCSPPAIWCSSPPAASCESPLGAGPLSSFRSPKLLVVLLLFMIDLLGCLKEEVLFYDAQCKPLQRTTCGPSAARACWTADRYDPQYRRHLPGGAGTGDHTG